MDYPKSLPSHVTCLQEQSRAVLGSGAGFWRSCTWCALPLPIDTATEQHSNTKPGFADRIEPVLNMCPNEICLLKNTCVHHEFLSAYTPHPYQHIPLTPISEYTPHCYHQIPLTPISICPSLLSASKASKLMIFRMCLKIMSWGGNFETELGRRGSPQILGFCPMLQDHAGPHFCCIVVKFLQYSAK